jgi:hypothetical protein
MLPLLPLKALALLLLLARGAGAAGALEGLAALPPPAGDADAGAAERGAACCWCRWRVAVPPAAEKAAGWVTAAARELDASTCRRPAGMWEAGASTAPSTSTTARQQQPATPGLQPLVPSVMRLLVGRLIRWEWSLCGQRASRSSTGACGVRWRLCARDMHNLTGCAYWFAKRTRLPFTSAYSVGTLPPPFPSRPRPECLPTSARWCSRGRPRARCAVRMPQLVPGAACVGCCARGGAARCAGRARCAAVGLTPA